MSKLRSWRELIYPTWIYCQKPENCVGGSLHIVLDDGNVEDEHVAFCVDYAERNNDPDGVALAKLLLSASLTQRRKLYTNSRLWRDDAPEPTNVAPPREGDGA